MEVHLCPNCHGQKTVSKAPYIAGDQPIWTASDTQTYPCPTCDAKGYIEVDGPVVSSNQI